MTSLSTRPDPPRRDGVVTPLADLDLGGAPMLVGGFIVRALPERVPPGRRSGRAHFRRPWYRPGRALS